VLGALLFLIYINDIDCNIKNCILKFDDEMIQNDTKFFRKIMDENNRDRLQQDLLKLVT